MSLTNTTKRERVECVVHQNIIDCHSSTCGLLNHLFYCLRETKKKNKEEYQTLKDVLNLLTPVVSSHLLIRAEDVKGKWFLSLIDEADGILHVTHSHYG